MPNDTSDFRLRHSLGIRHWDLVITDLGTVPAPLTPGWNTPGFAR
jgi:hypothetical protein